VVFCNFAREQQVFSVPCNNLVEHVKTLYPPIHKITGNYPVKSLTNRFTNIKIEKIIQLNFYIV